MFPDNFEIGFIQDPGDEMSPDSFKIGFIQDLDNPLP